MLSGTTIAQVAALESELERNEHDVRACVATMPDEVSDAIAEVLVDGVAEQFIDLAKLPQWTRFIQALATCAFARAEIANLRRKIEDQSEAGDGKE